MEYHLKPSRIQVIDTPSTFMELEIYEKEYRNDMFLPADLVNYGRGSGRRRGRYLLDANSPLKNSPSTISYRAWKTVQRLSLFRIMADAGLWLTKAPPASWASLPETGASSLPIRTGTTRSTWKNEPAVKQSTPGKYTRKNLTSFLRRRKKCP